MPRCTLSAFRAVAGNHRTARGDGSQLQVTEQDVVRDMESSVTRVPGMAIVGACSPNASSWVRKK